MHLQKIKLAGFKSFVDPTTVPIQSKLVAIVGPNGCGKSNIIDAVCWVMGESSAKYLRGQSLTDVIFNGSSARKPVGQASVELVFDNQDGTLGGEYAKFSDISIKRMINREGDSTYYLNGSRCRRRDIIDIFLGTGLGPRSYAIIGQNMISRLIEAKPDEMRIYLEEAAGISKYKERRRETENRINHTKENLARLDDVRNELSKQLATLQRQANAAEKFKTLKQEERLVKARWLVAQWRHYDAQAVQSTLDIQQQETGLEAKHAEVTSLTLEIDCKRENQRLANESLQEIQGRFYSAGNEVSKIEQEIRYTEEKHHQWLKDNEQVERDLQQQQSQLSEAEMEASELNKEVVVLEPQLQTAKDSHSTLNEKLSESEQAMQAWQNAWDEFNDHFAKITRTADVEQTRIKHLEQQIQFTQQRHERLTSEKSQIDFASLEIETNTLQTQVNELSSLKQQKNEQLQTLNQRLQRTKQEQDQIVRELDQSRQSVQRLKGQQASLEALQETALGERNNTVLPLLSKYQLDKNPKLAKHIEVESGWEKALEKVLGPFLQAICVKSLESVLKPIEEVNKGSLSLYLEDHAVATPSSTTTLLSDKVKSSFDLTSLLNGVHALENLEEAMAYLPKLQTHESIITRDGIWLNRQFLRVSKEQNAAEGIFQREQELKKLANQLTAAQEAVITLETKLKTCRDQITELETQRENLQRETNQIHSDLSKAEAQLKIKQEKHRELTNRLDRFTKELTELSNNQHNYQDELTKSRDNWQEALSKLEHYEQEKLTHINKRDALRLAVQTHRDNFNKSKDDIHGLQIRLQTSKSQLHNTQQAINRTQQLVSQLLQRQEALKHQENLSDQIASLQERLISALDQRLLIEKELKSARQIIESFEHELHNLESLMQSIQREIAKIRDMLETLRVDEQSIKVKAETLLEQLQETSYSLTEILSELPVDISPVQWQQELDQITNRIHRLGAINLIAIEEFSACSARKDYLDQQYADLQQGLMTLENAIAKIDKETKIRFRETFDKVNQHFQHLFPKVFGGGKAYLELTDENLLDTGVTVMACPPGKRNSSIHLLSGGEKTMTALALVFSIFHLNPAPFCLLDEVDAALDDANIGRFCHLVKTMAEKTQFIFISHNKLAIEMGEYLMGVTMHEPGVSRLVSVNVEEAVSLAGA